LSHRFPTLTYGRASIWVYDTGADLQSSNYLGLTVYNSQLNESGAYVTAWDYDLGLDNGGSYVFGVPGVLPYRHTFIDRTRAWHNWVIDSQEDELLVHVDGIEVHRGPGGRLFDTVQFHLSGPVWRPLWTGYYDDFQITLTAPSPSWKVDSNGNWSVPGNWNNGVPDGPGANAVFGGSITAPRTVTIDEPVSVGRISFDNSNSYTVSGSNALTIDATNGNARIEVLSGRHTISAPVILADDTEINITPQASNLSITGILNAGELVIKKSGPGGLTVNGVRTSRLEINEGALTIAPNGTSANMSVLGALAIAGGATPTAKLDVTDNAVAINYIFAPPTPTIRSQLLAGRGGPGLGATWTGQGITSSAAAAANATDADSRSVGYAHNGTMPLGPYTTFGGQAVLPTSMLIAYTRTGDANLDGVVNDDDVTIVGASYAPGVSNASWAFGDFDYNGFVDDDDVTLLGVFYDPSAPPLVAPAADDAIPSVAVPEPGTIGLLLVSVIAITVTRNRRKR
jgi:hypothetical protein